MAENPGHSVPRPFTDRDQATPNARSEDAGNWYGADEGRATSSGPLTVHGRTLLELGDPCFEADEVLGEFAGRPHLHEFFYTRPVDPS